MFCKEWLSCSKKVKLKDEDKKYMCCKKKLKKTIFLKHLSIVKIRNIFITFMILFHAVISCRNQICEPPHFSQD